MKGRPCERVYTASHSSGTLTMCIHHLSKSPRAMVRATATATATARAMATARATARASRVNAPPSSSQGPSCPRFHLWTTDSRRG